jgi:uncharacterized protein (TIGR03435 family)
MPTPLSRVRAKLAWAMLFTGLVAASDSARGALDATQTQQDTTPVAFEVASIRLSNPKPQPLTLMLGPREFRHSSATLERLVRLAYQVPRSMEIVGGPGWVRSEKFSVAAKFPDGATTGQLPSMLRELLGRRFGLLVHSEKRDRQFLRLTLARQDGQLGPELRRSSGCAKRLLPAGEDVFCGTGGRSSESGREVTYFGVFQEISVLVNQLVTVLGEPVQDGTGLAGKFDFDLTYDSALEPLRADSPNVSHAPTIFAALKEQLGLELKSVRGPIDTLVIDRADRPAVE